MQDYTESFKIFVKSIFHVFVFKILASISLLLWVYESLIKPFSPELPSIPSSNSFALVLLLSGLFLATFLVFHQQRLTIKTGMDSELAQTVLGTLYGEGQDILRFAHWHEIEPWMEKSKSFIAENFGVHRATLFASQVGQTFMGGSHKENKVKGCLRRIEDLMKDG